MVKQVRLGELGEDTNVTPHICCVLGGSELR